MSQVNSTTLWYCQPARAWNEALPLGNGRLGAMVFGGISHERLQLNEETVWSGGPKEWNNPAARALLPELRRLIAEGRYAEADDLSKGMQGPWTQSYQPMGNLHLHFPGIENQVDSYHRDLDLDTSLASVRYQADRIMFTRETFCSFVDQVIIMRLTCDQDGKLIFAASLDSQLRYRIEQLGDRSICLRGQCPSHVEPNYVSSEEPIRYQDDEGVRFEIRLQVDTEDGEVNVDTDAVHIIGANEARLLVAARTSFNGADCSPVSEGQDFGSLVAADLDRASRLSYDELYERHVRDHQGLFRRTSFSLGATPAAEKPTDERIAASNIVDDPALLALLFQYGRYLLIASSRPGTHPANLQGIWNDEMRPPWSSNWTTNLNTEMNYWHAEPANLSECVEPLIDFIRELSRYGQETAVVNYGCRGWTAHHNVDLWMQTAPPGNYGEGHANWAMWPLGSAWLSQHLWEHYLFDQDLLYLREIAYPLMKGAAEFCLDWLIEQNGYYVTSPSSSPENVFHLPNGQIAALSTASTADMALIWDLFDNCVAAAECLDVDFEFRARLIRTRDRLFPPQIGQYGQLQEWSHDWDLPADDHRHISHLIGLFPGKQLTPETTPELCLAAAQSLDLRGDIGTAWSLMWKAACRARLGDGDHAFELFEKLMIPSTAHEIEYHASAGVYPNLFMAHPPFQIDANFCAVVTIVEMLLQSHVQCIHLLPALPRSWSNGSVKGLRARGGFEVDMLWRDSKVIRASVRSVSGGTCRVKSIAPLRVNLEEARYELGTKGETIIMFQTVRGCTYTLTPADEESI
ncbi:MAG: glycoside hydrolase family 95 protein [Anaerolineae bacterium]|nr:glycoside hydrolase family 95 protein [Anaerolineae bacterium]